MKQILTYKQMQLLLYVVLIWSALMILILSDQTFFAILILLASAGLFTFSRMQQKEEIVTHNLIKHTIENSTEPLSTDTHVQVSELNKINEQLEQLTKEQSLTTFVTLCIKTISNPLNIVLGLYYTYEKSQESYNYMCGYAVPEELQPTSFVAGDGLNGEAVLATNITVISNIPQDYPCAYSGLGYSVPTFLILIPIYQQQVCIGLFELGTFTKPTEDDMTLFKALQNHIEKNAEAISL